MTDNGQVHTAQKTIATNRRTNAVGIIEEDGRYFHVFNFDRNGPTRGREPGDYVIMDDAVWRTYGYGNKILGMRFIRDIPPSVSSFEETAAGKREPDTLPDAAAEEQDKIARMRAKEVS